MVREQEKEKQKYVQNSKMKIHPSKLRKTSNGGSCCWLLKCNEYPAIIYSTIINQWWSVMIAVTRPVSSVPKTFC